MIKSLFIIIAGWFGLAVQPIVPPTPSSIQLSASSTYEITASSSVSIKSQTDSVVHTDPLAIARTPQITRKDAQNATQKPASSFATGLTSPSSIVQTNAYPNTNQQSVASEKVPENVPPSVLQDSVRKINVIDYIYSCNRALLFDAPVGMMSIVTWLNGTKPSKGDTLESARVLGNQGENYLLYNSYKSESRVYVTDVGTDSSQMIDKYLGYCPFTARSYGASTYMNMYGDTVQVYK